MERTAPYLIVKSIPLPKVAARKFSTRLGNGHWVVLTAIEQGTWNVEVWGPRPAHFTVAGLTETEAKERALDLAASHIPDDIRTARRVNWNTVCLRTA